MRREAVHPLLCSRREAARLLGVSEDTLRRRPDLFPPVEFPNVRRVLYRVAEVRAWAAGPDRLEGNGR